VDEEDDELSKSLIASEKESKETDEIFSIYLSWEKIYLYIGEWIGERNFLQVGLD
jgi:hypothetical protein